MLKILGYPDRYSVAPGETISFKVSLEEGTSYEASLVRVIHGDANPEGPGLKLELIKSAIDGRHQGERQGIDAGSCMIVDDFPALPENGAFTLFAFVWPTLPRAGWQTLAAQWDAQAQAGFMIGLEDHGHLALRIGDGSGAVETVRLKASMLERKWYGLCVSLDPADASARLAQRPLVADAFIADTDDQTFRLPVSVASVTAPFHLAGAPQADGTIGEHYDGKIDDPTLLRGSHPPELHDSLLASPRLPVLRRDIIAAWDFSRDIPTMRAVDASPHGHDGRLVNLPARGMKGWNWTGAVHRWTERPEEYGAIHFHHDDLYDAGWRPSLTLTVPQDMKNGAYALKVACGESGPEAAREYYIPFFVRPPRSRGPRFGRPKVAFLAPTCAYMAYANHAEHITAREAERTIGRLLQFGQTDVYMHDHPELGGSLYDSHADGSGVCYSSRLRPVLNMSPRYHSWLGGHGSGLWQYNADTHLLDWLAHQGIDYDIVTDEDLHEEGYPLLADYRVILSGTHPEYHSTRMWDAMKAWLDRGGRLMYLGANGWYWRIAFHDELPGVIEVRRAEDGIRTWAAEPGEYLHSFTGEMGGLWRRIGRPPNLMGTVGFIAQGFDVSSYYRRAPDAENPRAAFILKGVEDEIIGDFGLIGGGAAGLELDCITMHLGSPRNTLRLASSENHSALVMLVNEEFGVVPPNLGGDQNVKVRADLAFAETPSGGAVFATGSIAWCGSLSHNGYDNNVSRITLNVLRRFLDETPFVATAEGAAPVSHDQTELQKPR